MQIPVPSLKEQIGVFTGVSSYQQQLVFRGRDLRDDKLLSDYRIPGLGSRAYRSSSQNPNAKRFNSVYRWIYYALVFIVLLLVPAHANSCCASCCRITETHFAAFHLISLSRALCGWFWLLVELLWFLWWMDKRDVGIEWCRQWFLIGRSNIISTSLNSSMISFLQLLKLNTKFSSFLTEFSYLFIILSYFVIIFYGTFQIKTFITNNVIADSWKQYEIMNSVFNS